MAISWAKNDTDTTTIAGRKSTLRLLVYTHIQHKSFLKFTAAAWGLSVDDVESVRLRIRVTYSVGTDNYKLYSAKSGDSNWGVALTADATDWLTTQAHLEDTVAIGSTGYKYFDINKNNIDWAGWTWFKIMGSFPAYPAYSTITFGAQNHATVAYRPTLIITLKRTA